jgi:hypothetical protein
MNSEKIYEFVDNEWDNSIIPKLKEYIKIPNQSPDYDSKWYFKIKFKGKKMV